MEYKEMTQNKTYVKMLYVEYTKILDMAHVKHKGTHHSCLGLPSLLKILSVRQIQR